MQSVVERRCGQQRSRHASWCMLVPAAFAVLLWCGAGRSAAQGAPGQSTPAQTLPAQAAQTQATQTVPAAPGATTPTQIVPTPTPPTSAAATAAQPYTLHVYESLVQVPTLVLTTTHESYRGLQPSRFFVQLDGGARFHPTRVHLEGDDPLSLTVLLDAHAGEQEALLQKAAQALARMPANSFTAQDHLTVFGFDCSLVHAAVDQPASVGQLSTSVADVLAAPHLHSSGDAGHCRAPLHLWDAVAAVTGVVGKLPGRRVLVLITDGHDQGSKNSLSAVTQYATGYGLAVFGLEPAPPPQPVVGGSVANGLLLETALTTDLGSLCGGTGGMVMGSSAGSLAQEMTRVLHLIRARYILEFPRFRNGSNGVHEIDVTTSDFSAVVRTSGVSVALEDKALAADPTTVHSDTSGDPTLGQSRKSKRRRP